MDDTLKTLLLINKVCNNGNSVWERIKALNIGPSDLLKQGPHNLAVAGFSEGAVKKFTESLKAGWAEREYERCLEAGIEITAHTDACYPKPLFDLREPPLLIYIWGNLKNIPERSFAVVGTRRATAYGRKMAGRIGEECGASDIVLVSGGAAGIDGCAHRRTLRGGGKTVAVLGTGIDKVFPSSHRALFDEIKDNGALISEFPLRTDGAPWHFPKRNRIVAALAQRVVIVEAPLKSGAMITARLALELGREVWAVPGRIDEEVSSGNNMLIFDGAQPLVNMDVFFGSCSHQTALFEDVKGGDPAVCGIMTVKGEAILSLLKLSGDRTVDNIAQEVKMSAAEVMNIIAVLSACGLVQMSGPGRYSAKI